MKFNLYIKYGTDKRYTRILSDAVQAASLFSISEYLNANRQTMEMISDTGTFKVKIKSVDE